jgi:hypothetical protein
VLKSVGVPVDAPEASLFRGSMKIEQLPYANIVKLRVRGYSAEDAEQLAKATATVLHAAHAQIAAAPMGFIRDRLAAVDALLKDAQERRNRLLAGNSGRGDQTALTDLAVATSDQDIRSLEQMRADLALRQLPNYTYETSLAWPVYVDKDRVFPNTVLTLGIGLLAAAFLASLAAVARHALRSHRLRSPA